MCLEGGVRGVLVQMAASSSSSEFEWGERVAGLENSYERMCFRGVWYGLYDCVHVRSLAEEPHVGKIMRLYEEDGKREMRVRWFLRSGELPLSVSKELSARDKKELFIAQGSVKGVENVNLVETIVRKINVLCTAKIPRNPQPSQQQVAGAHYFFNRAYDASQRKLLKIDRVDKVLAGKFYNKPEWLVNASWEDLGRKRLSPDSTESSCGIEDMKVKKFKGDSS